MYKNDANRWIGVIDTDFPDLWSKVAVRSHAAGSILWIPRERNMTRLYVQLSETDGERVERSKATPEYVIQRAKDAMHPFHLEWKTIEWFGNYVVGQRVAKHFTDSNAQVFIAGDVRYIPSPVPVSRMFMLIINRLDTVTRLLLPKEQTQVCTTVLIWHGN